MRELWPVPTPDLDIAARLAGDERVSPGRRPWVVLSMISSLDGAVAMDGLSGGLGGSADHARFVAMRRLVDGIVVGAGTVRAENYRPTSVPIYVVSGTLNLDPELRLFSDPDAKPVVFTSTQAATTSAELDGSAEIVDLGDSITPQAIVDNLGGRGAEVVGLEGGPTLNGQFLEADLVDEILLSVSPLAVAGDAQRITHGPTLAAPHRFNLARLSIDEDFVFLRYVRRR